MTTLNKINIGILGGGQLGRMLAIEAQKMGYNIITYCPKNGEAAPAEAVSNEIIYAEYDNKKSLTNFADKCHLVSFEFENIPAETIKLIEKNSIVRPNSSSIFHTQHRLRERNFLKQNKFPTHKFWAVKNSTDLEKAFKSGLKKGVLKTAAFGYDGKGQRIINKGEDYKKTWDECKFGLAVLEEFIPFEKEISVVLARDINGNIETFPIGQNIHEQGILKKSIVPAKISSATKKQATDVAIKIAKKLDYVGVMAVEFFVLKNGKILVNEIAPRVHNSGHYTQDGCNVSQFTQHIRAICGLPLIKPKLLYKKVTMENLIGDDIHGVEKYFMNKNARVHLYGKTEVKEGRKMGHVNFVG